MYDQMEAMKAATKETTEEKGPDKFDPIAFPEWWHGVTNVFGSMRSSLNPQISLRYVIRPDVPDDYTPADDSFPPCCHDQDHDARAGSFIFPTVLIAATVGTTV